MTFRTWQLVLAGLALGLMTLGTTAEAAKPKRAKPKNQQRAAIMAKYDTNKDGKLSKGERAQLTPADAAALGKKKK